MTKSAVSGKLLFQRLTPRGEFKRTEKGDGAHHRFAAAKLAAARTGRVRGHRANSFAYPAAEQPSARACGFAFAGTRSRCCHARTEDNTRSKKRDGADLGSARPASEASCADEKDTAIDRLADDRDAFDHSHLDTEAAIGNRANTDAALLGVARGFNRDFDSPDLELSFLKPWKTQGQSIWMNQTLTAKSTPTNRC
jgi:hypothetical protein